MSISSGIAGQMSLFGDDDLFGEESDAFLDFGAAKAAAEEEKKAAEAKAAAKKEKASKPAATKATATKKPQKKGTEFTGPVKVVGFGWEYDFTPTAGKATTKDILEAALKAGYEEVGIEGVSSTYLQSDKGNFIFLKIPYCASDDNDDLVPAKVKVVLGQKKAEFDTSVLGIEPDGFTLGDLKAKYLEVVPEFAGMANIAVDGQTGVAMPLFEEVEAKKMPSASYTLFKEGGNEVLEGTGAELAESLQARYGGVKTVKFYKADNLYFAAFDSGTSTGCTGDDIVPHQKSGGTKGKAEKKYDLPFAVYFTVTAQYLGKDKVSLEAFELTAADFGGKERVTEKEVFDLVKGNNPCFSIQGKTYPMQYIESEKTFYIGMAMGKLGSPIATKVIPFHRPITACGIKTLKLPIGEFKGEVAGDMADYRCLGFKRSLPKVPFALLQYVIAYFRQDLSKEAMVYIVWNMAARSYQIQNVDYEATKVECRYGPTFFSKRVIPVMQVHSHNTMPAIFSQTDDHDQVITGLYGVIGELDTDHPSVTVRASFEGKFLNLPLTDIFDGVGSVA